MLDKQSENFLKYIIKNSKNNTISELQRKSQYIGIDYDTICDICKSLESEGYIDCIYADDGVFAIFLRNKGLSYFETKKHEILRFWFPVLISLIALLRPEIIWLIKFILKKMT